MHHVAGIHRACETSIQMDGHGSGDMTNRDLICLGETMSKMADTKNLKANTISCIFTSWNGLKRQARVCICREPLMLFLTHSFSFWQSAMGVNSFLEISWIVSEPQTSQVFA